MADNSQYSPYNSYRFLVRIETGTKSTVGAFTNFSGIKMTTRMARARTGADKRGVKDNFPGITEFENVTLSKGVIGDNAFLKWAFNANFPRQSEAPMGDNIYRNLQVIALTPKGEPGIVWTLLNATPVSYELKEMDANSNTVLMESIEFAITGVTRETKIGPNQ